MVLSALFMVSGISNFCQVNSNEVTASFNGYNFKIMQMESLPIVSMFVFCDIAEVESFKNKAKQELLSQLGEIEMECDKVSVSFFYKISDYTTDSMNTLLKSITDYMLKNGVRAIDIPQDTRQTSIPAEQVFSQGLRLNLPRVTYADEKPKRENYLLGTIGAILGALIGSLLYIVLMLIGDDLSIGGVFISIGVIGGYFLFAKGFSKVGLIISSVILIATVVSAWYAGIVILFMVQGDCSVDEAVEMFRLGMAVSSSFKDSAQKTLLLSYIFSILGAVGLMVKLGLGYFLAYSSTK